MLNKLKSLFILHSLFLGSTSYAENCMLTNFKYIYNRETIVLPLTICKKEDSYFSKSCFNKKCRLKKRLLRTDFEIRPIGSPHFLMCHKINATPIIGKVYDKWSPKKEWLSTSLCFDRRKKDFVSGSYILGIGFKQKNKPKEN